jgi:hypothetical protein
MESTCSKEKCLMWNLFDGKCPNHMENWFTEDSMKKPVLFEDCAPKRTLIMVQDLHNRLIGVQKSQEQLRNECVNLEAFSDVIASRLNINLESFMKKRIEIEQRNKETKFITNSEG